MNTNVINNVMEKLKYLENNNIVEKKDNGFRPTYKMISVALTDVSFKIN